MKKRTLIAVGTIIGASAFALFKSPKGKDIQKQIREKLEEKANEDKSAETKTLAIEE